MILNIALGIVLGFTILAVAPFVIGLIFMALGMIGEGVGNLLRKSKTEQQEIFQQSQNRKNVTPAAKPKKVEEPDILNFRAWLKWLFTQSHYGRLTRLGFLKVKIVLIFISLIGLAVMAMVAMSEQTVLIIVAGIGMMALYVLVAYRSITSDIQRLHDFNASGWWVLAIILVSLVPGIGEIVSLVALAVFLFVPGTAGENRFGSHSTANNVIETEPQEQDATPNAAKSDILKLEKKTPKVTRRAPVTAKVSSKESKKASETRVLQKAPKQNSKKIKK